MGLNDLKSSLLSLASAGLSSLCCVLPLVIVLLGLGTGAFMATTMKFKLIFIPLGLAGLIVSYVLYLRGRRVCISRGCQGIARANAIILGFSTLIILAALLLTIFPGLTAEILTGVR